MLLCMKSFTISDFKVNFSEIMEQVRSGEKITLTDNGENLAVITPCTPHKGEAVELEALKDETLIIHDDFEMSEEELIDRAAAFAEIDRIAKEARAH